MLPNVFEILSKVDCEHQEFELVDIQESNENVIAWLGGLPKDNSKITVFAEDGTGGFFCLFQKEGTVDLDSAPVIYLGSEGDVAPVSKSPEEFIDFVGSQLTFTAYDDFSGLFDELEDEEDPYIIEVTRKKRTKIRKAFETFLGRKLQDPMEVLQEARDEVGDLREWVEENK